MEQGEKPPADLDARQVAIRVGDDEILVSWHGPNTPPDGQAHGAEGICVTGTGDVVVISRDGRRWELPAGRPERGETWEQTLCREVREEACATVVRARLPGFSDQPDSSTASLAAVAAGSSPFSTSPPSSSYPHWSVGKR